MLSRAAMHETQILLQCAQCKAGVITDVLRRRALCPAALPEVRVHADVASGPERQSYRAALGE